MKTNSKKYFLSFKNRNEISDEKLIGNRDVHRGATAAVYSSSPSRQLIFPYCRGAAAVEFLETFLLFLSNKPANFST